MHLVSERRPQRKLYLNKIERCWELPSTNDYLANGLKNNLNDVGVCIAEYQTAGKGRNAKQWLSPFGYNIYFSLQHQLTSGLQQLSGLTLAIGVGVCRVLRNLDLEQCQIKWPNDIFVKQQKIAGVLTEIVTDSAGNFHVIVGIGLNVKLPGNLKLDQAATDLHAQGLTLVERNLLVAQLIAELDPILSTVQLNGWQDYEPEWRELDYLLGQAVTVKTINAEHQGVSKGIDNDGHLQVQVGDQLMCFSAADVSVRAAK